MSTVASAATVAAATKKTGMLGLEEILPGAKGLSGSAASDV
jgi:hypothetical protein